MKLLGVSHPSPNRPSLHISYGFFSILQIVLSIPKTTAMSSLQKMPTVRVPIQSLLLNNRHLLQNILEVKSWKVKSDLHREASISGLSPGRLDLYSLLSSPNPQFHFCFAFLYSSHQYVISQEIHLTMHNNIFKIKSSFSMYLIPTNLCITDLYGVIFPLPIALFSVQTLITSSTEYFTSFLNNISFC